MPTYDYECEACGHRFEAFHSMSDPPVKTCPECGKRKVRKLIGTGAGILFKGSGFYQTDYRSSDYQKEAKKDRPPESKSDGDKGKDKGKAKDQAKDQAKDKPKSSGGAKKTSGDG